MSAEALASQTASEYVYGVFRGTGEDEGNVVFELLRLARTLDNALPVWFLEQERQRRIKSRHVKPIVKGMSVENDYTHYGNRDDVDTSCPFGHYGGLIIERLPLF